MRIPLASPEITAADIQAVVNVLRSSSLSIGPRLQEFEKAFARYIGVPFAVAVSSGTAGLHLCVRALGIANGDEVIVPSFTFIAAANVIRYEKAIPVFVDIDPISLNLDPAKIEAAITSRTRAILVVHTFGCPADMSAINEIASRHHLRIIEDACESLGAEFLGRKTGSMGDAGVFGFYPNKQITTGEGGMIVTSSPELASLAKKLRNQGRDESEDWMQHTELGCNYRLSEMNCALGLQQLGRIEVIRERREEVACEYRTRLRGCPELILPAHSLPHRRISWFVYAVRLSREFDRKFRDSLVREMAARGIGCGRYFAPVHMQPIYGGEPSQYTHLRVTEEIADRVLALPFFHSIKNEQIDEVCSTLKELLQRGAG